MQFWLVGFGLSLAKVASENFRQFSGKKPKIEIDSERTEVTSTLLTYTKEYGHTEIPNSEQTVTFFRPFLWRATENCFWQLFNSCMWNQAYRFTTMLISDWVAIYMNEVERSRTWMLSEQDAHWHFRVMLLSGLIIPIVLTSQIFKAVSFLRDFSQKDCVILHHNNRSSLPIFSTVLAAARYVTWPRTGTELGPVQFVFHSIISYKTRSNVLNKQFPLFLCAYCSSVSTIPLLFSVNEKLAIQLTTALMF